MYRWRIITNSCVCPYIWRNKRYKVVRDRAHRRQESSWPATPFHYLLSASFFLQTANLCNFHVIFDYNLYNSYYIDDSKLFILFNKPFCFATERLFVPVVIYVLPISRNTNPTLPDTSFSIHLITLCYCGVYCKWPSYYIHKLYMQGICNGLLVCFLCINNIFKSHLNIFYDSTFYS